MLIETILDNAQEFLHDDGAIWPRSELLNWCNDGYRQLIAQSRAIVRPFQLDLPGRTSWAGTQEWEDRHADGTYRKLTLSVLSSAIQATSRWEAETLEGIEPTQSLEATSQLWERTLSGEQDAHFTFVTSKAHEQPRKVYWDDKRLFGASTRELDLLETDWWSMGGQPLFFFPSNAGRDGSYEVYEIVTTYHQTYDLREMENGIPREFSGSRTYGVAQGADRWDYAYSDAGSAGGVPGLGWRFTGQAADTDRTYYTYDFERETVESGDDFDDADPVGTSPFDSAINAAEEVFLGIGLGREIRSADRQYVPAPYDSGAAEIFGGIRDFKSSEDSLTIWEVITPTRPLTESDTPGLIPQQFGKYLKFYVLSRAFSRKGQGFRPDLAQHFTQLFQIGVGVLTKLADLSLIDRVYARQDFIASGTLGRPPRVQLPSNYERQW